jgi:hypothetical protein
MYGPEAFKAIGEAFDAAGAEIAGNFGNDPAEIDAARAKARQGHDLNRSDGSEM